MIKLKQYSRKQPCYYCGAPGPSSREHTPPQMMFSGFDSDSITVPSCDKHNSQKNIGDRAIITAIIMSASQMHKHADKLNIQLTPNVITAIELAKSNFHQAKNEVELRPALVDPPDGLDIPLPYIEASVNIRGWMRQLTAGLVWAVVGRHDPNIEWDKAITFSAGYLETAEPLTSAKTASMLLDYHDLEDRQFRLLPWQAGWSATPKKYPSDIYSFDICFPKNSQDFLGMNVVFRHKFYNSSSVWYVLFNTSQGTAEALRVAID